MMHKVPLLWRVHRVHHTDTELDVSTTVRFLAALLPAIDDLARAIRTGDPPLLAPEDGLGNARILDRLAAAAGRAGPPR